MTSAARRAARRGVRGRGGAGRRRRSRPFAHAASGIRLAEPASRCRALAVGLVRLPCSPVGGRLLPPHVVTRRSRSWPISAAATTPWPIVCFTRRLVLAFVLLFVRALRDSRFLDACGCAARADGVFRHPHLPWNGQGDLSDEPFPPGGIAGDARAQPDAVEGGAARRSRALVDASRSRR